MAEPLSHISLADLKRLNAFAVSDAPSAHENLARLIGELARANDSRALCGISNHLVAGGRGVHQPNRYTMIEAILDFPDSMQHPVEQVSACVALLRRHRDEMPQELRHSRVDIQRRLSHLLIEYPVLMDHRLVYSVCTPNPEWSSLGVALAEACFASLPTLSDGLTSRQLRIFACNSSVKSSLDKPNLDFCPGTSSVLGARTALQVALPADPAATRGGFLCSLLALDQLARDFSDRGIVSPQQLNGNVLGIYRGLGRSVWDLTARSGASSALAADQLRCALSLPSAAADTPYESGVEKESDATFATSGKHTFSQGNLRWALAMDVDEVLFSSNVSPVPNLGEHELRARTLNAVACLARLGVMPNEKAAAEWLASVVIGKLRLASTTAGPRCHSAAALGFLNALHEHGVAAELAYDPANAELWGTGAEQVWVSAVQIFNTRVAMEQVFARHEASAPYPPAAARNAPGARVRRRLL